MVILMLAVYWQLMLAGYQLAGREANRPPSHWISKSSFSSNTLIYNYYSDELEDQSSLTSSPEMSNVLFTTLS